jgi:hypothetical protein
MTSDIEVLAAMNQDINTAENDGAAAALDKVLAASFAFRRANGAVARS